VQVWNDLLASMAKTWAAGCVWEHGQPPVDTSSLPSPGVGQNMYMSSPSINVTAAVQSWYDEKYDYNYESNTCADGRACGHYTQVRLSS